ncbi:MAG: hypothetical protein BM564_13545 [Bacteroidetes bacterium MedPE-SWsnd-G2]|nr:MAG: hypothetical protein BM564_13545 [Bacteroidetes bacterium MedPE-SWsnd-G2]
MKTVKTFIPIVIGLVLMLVISGYVRTDTIEAPKPNHEPTEKPSVQNVNFFVTHGHCSTPFSGQVENLKLKAPHKNDLSNPLENMTLDFEIDPNTFSVCKAEELTERIKTPGLFITETNEKFVFRSTNVYTMGIDWYQVNGKLSIKGVEKDVKFFVTGIRNENEINTNTLVLQGQFNLLDWGIDYDKIVSGESDPVPTKWMYINMKIDRS